MVSSIIVSFISFLILLYVVSLKKYFILESMVLLCLSKMSYWFLKIVYDLAKKGKKSVLLLTLSNIMDHI